MKKLPEYAKSLILQGASTTGNLIDGFYYVEEQIKSKDHKIVKEFCEWVKTNIGACSRYNIDMLFAAFRNPGDAELQKQANELAALIKSIKIA